MSNAHGPSLAALASVAFTAPCLATTWIVDDNGGPGVDFVSIQAAVDAAVDGDVIEVRDGDYAGFTIDGESLVVVAASGAVVRVAAPLVVRNVPAGGAVELDGLEIGNSLSGIGTATLLEQNSGSVRLVDCEVVGQSDDCYYGAGYPDQAVRAEESDRVALLRCTLRGGHGGDEYDEYDCFGSPGASAIRADASHVTALDCELTGGVGGAGDNHDGSGGGDGATLLASTLLAHRSTIAGGGGGAPGCSSLNCCCNPCFGLLSFICNAGNPGYGVRLIGGSTLSWKDSTIGFAFPPENATEVAIAPYCLGTFEECPCGNNGEGTAGCEHSFGLGGARLEGVGNASVAADTVTLQVTGLGTGGAPTVLFFQGTTGSEGTPFNDGLLCAGGSIVRMKGKAASNGTVSFGFGQAGDPLVSAAGQLPPAGGTRYYQVWYRNNNASFCTPLRFNMSNGVEIAWAP